VTVNVPTTPETDDASRSEGDDAHVAPDLRSVDDVDADIAAAQKELNALAEREAEVIAQSEVLQELITDRENALSELQTWVESIDRSFSWKLQERMSANLAQAQGHLGEFEAAVSGLQVPARGVLAELRDRFYRRLGRGFAALLAPLLIGLIIFLLLRFGLGDVLANLLSSGGEVGTIVGILVVSGVVLLVLGLIGRRTGNRWLSAPVLRRIALVIVVVAVIVLLVTLLSRPSGESGPGIPGEIAGIAGDIIAGQVLRWLNDNLWWIILAYIGIMLATVVALLVAYYTGWSVFRRQVTEQFTQLENVSLGYRETKQEVKRLEQLYGQLSTWLEIIAHSLYRPWRIDPKWATSHELQMSAENFPFALRVAQATDAESAQVANLERLIAERLLQQGWRQEAFDDMLDAINAAEGYEHGRLSPQLLDADLPHQSNNSRELVLARLRAAARAAEEGDESQQQFLVEVARLRLRDLIRRTQSQVLSEARPDVVQIVVDPLEGVREGHMGVAGEIAPTTWDDFLRDALGITEEEPELSRMSFTEEGLANRAPSAVKTRLIVPARLADSLPAVDGRVGQVVPTTDVSTGRSAEVLVRFDAVGPVPFEHVRLVQAATGSLAPSPQIADAEPSVFVDDEVL
jgi:hypothetical protein